MIFFYLNILFNLNILHILYKSVKKKNDIVQIHTNFERKKHKTICHETVLDHIVFTLCCFV